MAVTTGLIIGLAGCSSESEGDEPESGDPTSEESEDSTSGADTQENSDSEDSTSDSSDSSTGNTSQEDWEDHPKIERYKSASSSWIEIPVGSLELPDYNSSREVAQYAKPGDSEYTDAVVVNSDGDIQVDLSQDSTEDLRYFVANNIFENNRADSVSVLLRYEEPDTSVIEEEYGELSWIFGMPVILSRLSEADFSGELTDATYPSDNIIEDHLFDEGAVETFFKDYVSGVRDSGNEFPERLLEYAEQ